MKSVFNEKELLDIQKSEEIEKEISVISKKINKIRKTSKSLSEIIKEKLIPYGKKYIDLKKLEDYFWHTQCGLDWEKDKEEYDKIVEERKKAEQEKSNLVIEALVLEMNMYLEVFGEIEYKYSDRGGGSFHTHTSEKWINNMGFTQDEFNSALSKVDCLSKGSNYDVPEHGVGGGIDCTNYTMKLYREKH